MRIAITGGIAEGKTTVLESISELGEATVSADDLARDIFNLPSVQTEISRMLGTDQKAEVESIRKQMLESNAFRRGLNALIHPLAVERIVSSRATWFEVPLLYEACIHGLFDRVWVATCGREEQLRRLEDRLGSAAQARALVATQLATPIKEAFADEIIRTNEAKDVVKLFVHQAVERELAK